MNVNGTRFHLVYGQSDWEQVFPVGENGELSDLPLAKLPEKSRRSQIEWNSISESLQLRQQTPLFRRAREKPRVPIQNRRGAARDQYGHWYWINRAEDGIRFLAVNEYKSVTFWHVDDYLVDCDDDRDDFRRDAAADDHDGQLVPLCGLAVTTNHYLVVGSITQNGVLIFDLHRGGPPYLLAWPDSISFEPWDIAATPDGGVLILDRTNTTLWRLDEHFRVLSDYVDEPALFQPADLPDDLDEDNWPNRMARRVSPHGQRLIETTNPISVEPGPDGSALILDTPENIEEGSRIIEYARDGSVTPMALQLDFRYTSDVDPADSAGDAPDRRVTDTALRVDTTSTSDDDPNGPPGIRGADFVYTTCTAKAPCRGLGEPSGKSENIMHLVCVVEERGNQAIVFHMNRAGARLAAQPTYLPMRRWAEKALVKAGDRVYYDFSMRTPTRVEESWKPLQVFDDCHYVSEGAFVTPADFSANIPEQPFDSNLPGCVWHRLLLDAEIPVTAKVKIKARAADEPDLLVQSPWIDLPDPYLRHTGAELPYFDPFARPRNHPPEDRAPTEEPTESPPAAEATLATPDLTDRAGTWETLFQEVKGRYLQLHITLADTGRSTPSLHVLRIWYPRFSYAEQYLPAIYGEDPVPAAFLERWLANFEGFFTGIEDAIEQVFRMFDPRTAPSETLEWLAGWVGLILDPLWPEHKRRFFIRHAIDLYRIRGTVAGIEVAIRMYVEPNLDEDLFNPVCWGRSRVRIVEDYLTRDVSKLLYGDVSDANPPDTPAPDTTPDEAATPDDKEAARNRVLAAAHRFTVLLPHNLTPEDELMVQRIVDLAKPAHTQHRIRRYWDLFRVGEARLGLDTQLGHRHYFVPHVLGETYLPDGYLEYSYPYNIDNRLVMGRDRLGDMPES